LREPTSLGVEQSFDPGDISIARSLGRFVWAMALWPSALDLTLDLDPATFPLIEGGAAIVSGGGRRPDFLVQVPKEVAQLAIARGSHCDV
jgi:hypothetical protein